MAQKDGSSHNRATSRARRFARRAHICTPSLPSNQTKAHLPPSLRALRLVSGLTGYEGVETSRGQLALDTQVPQDDLLLGGT